MANKALSVASVIEKNKVASSVAFLILAKIDVFDPTIYDFAETVYIANNDEAITFQGDVYVALPFDIELKSEAGAVPEINLTARDFQRVLLRKLEQYQGGIKSRVTIMVVNSGNLAQGVETQEVFEVLGSNSSDWSVSISLGVESALGRKFPSRTQTRDRCAWRYKGAECGYSGVMPTCDLSLQGANGCAAHDNSIRFGGFPGLVNRGIRV